MPNLSTNARRILKDRQAAFKPDSTGATQRPGSQNSHKGGAPAGRQLRGQGRNAAASRAANAAAEARNR